MKKKFATLLAGAILVASCGGGGGGGGESTGDTGSTGGSSTGTASVSGYAVDPAITGTISVELVDSKSMNPFSSYLVGTFSVNNGEFSFSYDTSKVNLSEYSYYKICVTSGTDGITNFDSSTPLCDFYPLDDTDGGSVSGILVSPLGSIAGIFGLTDAELLNYLQSKGIAIPDSINSVEEAETFINQVRSALGLSDTDGYFGWIAKAFVDLNLASKNKRFGYKVVDATKSTPETTSSMTDACTVYDSEYNQISDIPCQKDPSGNFAVDVYGNLYGYNSETGNYHYLMLLPNGTSNSIIESVYGIPCDTDNTPGNGNEIFFESTSVEVTSCDFSQFSKDGRITCNIKGTTKQSTFIADTLPACPSDIQVNQTYGATFTIKPDLSDVK